MYARTIFFGLQKNAITKNIFNNNKFKCIDDAIKFIINDYKPDFIGVATDNILDTQILVIAYKKGHTVLYYKNNTPDVIWGDNSFKLDVLRGQLSTDKIILAYLLSLEKISSVAVKRCMGLGASGLLKGGMSVKMENYTNTVNTLKNYGIEII